MIDLSTVPIDDLVLEMSIRLGRGEVGYHGLMSRRQADFRNAWTDLYLWVMDRQNEDFARWSPVARKMSEIISRGGHERRVVAVNTTLIGREGEVA